MVNAPHNLHTAKETDMTRYGYIGLGDMGSAMAENLIRNSSDVTVCMTSIRKLFKKQYNTERRPQLVQQTSHNRAT